MKNLLFVTLLLPLISAGQPDQKKETDVWKPLRYFVDVVAVALEVLVAASGVVQIRVDDLPCPIDDESRRGPRL